MLYKTFSRLEAVTEPRFFSYEGWGGGVGLIIFFFFVIKLFYLMQLI
jgi:hypothetical protein